MIKLIPWVNVTSPSPTPFGLGGKSQVKAPVKKPIERSTPLAQSDRPTPLLPPSQQVAGVTAVPTPATFTMPASQQQWFNDQNWEVPTPDRPAKTNEFKYRKRRDLAEYEYELSALQLQSMDDTLSNQPGYRPPVQVTDDPLDIEKEKRKAEAKKGVLTWKQYDKLSEDQKAAVDFNTRLVEARQRDLTGASLPISPEKQEQYNKDVREMFGEQGGSDTIALNTVELLKGIDFKAVGADLDEFLSLERAIDADELKGFTLTKDAPIEPLVQGQQQWINGNRPRMQVVETISNYSELLSPQNQAAIDSTLVRLNTEEIEAAMTDTERTFWSVDTALNPITPTKQNIKDIPFGFGGVIRDEGIPERLPTGEYRWTNDRFYESSWLALKIPDPEIKDPMAEVQQFFIDHQFTPQEQKQWYRTTYQRAMNEKQYGARQVTAADGVNRANRSPDEIIEMLNIGGRRG